MLILLAFVVCLHIIGFVQARTNDGKPPSRGEDDLSMSVRRRLAFLAPSSSTTVT